VKSWAEWGWDACCVASCIGIWPRYIEPCLLRTTRLTLPISRLPVLWDGFKILHFSDLHWKSRFSLLLRHQLIRQTQAFQPDLILFTGDFLCRAQLEGENELSLTLSALQAKAGCFAVLGNHDYAHFVTVNEAGEYDVEAPVSVSNVYRGFRRLYRPVNLVKRVTSAARQVGVHEGLIKLLDRSHFQLLNNESKLIVHKGSQMNICGLEEYTLGRFDPDVAFKNYQAQYPGIVLVHNPDTWPVLKRYPGDLILSGHTHGGQVNLPVLSKYFIRLEQTEFKRGLKRLGEKWAYVNRGISSSMKFRCFASPELTLITLQRGAT